MEKTYTIEQIRTYLQNVDSLGDALWYLNEFEGILKNAEDIEEECAEEDIYDIDYVDLQE